MDATTTSAVIGFFGGGAVGALISSRTNARIARATRRDKAADALWQYHYALTGVAALAGSDLADDDVPLVGADWDQVKSALQAAYPYAGYLTQSARSKLFVLAWIERDDNPYQEWWESAQSRHDVFSGLASMLESDLQWSFPQRFGDRFRGLMGIWRTWAERREARGRLKRSRSRRAR